MKHKTYGGRERCPEVVEWAGLRGRELTVKRDGRTSVGGGGGGGGGGVVLS